MEDVGISYRLWNGPCYSKPQNIQHCNIQPLYQSFHTDCGIITTVWQSWHPASNHLSASYGGYASLLNTISATSTLQLFVNVHVSRIVDHSSHQIHKTEVHRHMVRDRYYYYCNNVDDDYDDDDDGGGGGGGGGGDDDDDDGKSQEQKTTIRIIGHWT